MTATYVRFQAAERSPDGTHVGVFGLVNVLGRRGLLDADDEAHRVRMNRWFDAAYTDPSTVDATVYDRRVNPRTTAWFKQSSAQHLVDATLGHCALLTRYDVAWERVESDDPGHVIYEDEVQVVVVPRDDPGHRPAL